MVGSPQWRSGVFTGAGALLVAVGLFVSAGWPYVLAGFVLLVVATTLR